MDEHEQKDYERASVLKQFKRYDEAISIFMDLHLKHPDHAMTIAKLVATFVNIGKYEEALVYAHKLVAVQPNNTLTYNVLGVVLMKNGKIDEAEAAYDRAIAISPNYPEPFANKAQIWIRRKEFEKGLACAEEGLRLDPEHYDSLCKRLVCLYRLSEDEKFDAYIKDALRLYPDSYYLHYILGKQLLFKNKSAEAYQEFEIALSLDPTDEETQGELAIAFKKARPYRYLAMITQHVRKPLTIYWFILLGFFLVLDIANSVGHFFVNEYPITQIFLFVTLIVAGFLLFNVFISAPVSDIRIWFQWNSPQPLRRTTGFIIVSVLAFAALIINGAMIFSDSHSFVILPLVIPVSAAILFFSYIIHKY